MPIVQALLFLIKYGLGIMQLVRGVWELVDWIRARDDKVSINGKMMRQNLHVMARKAREAGDLTELKKMRDVLAKRKAEIEGGDL